MTKRETMVLYEVYMKEHAIDFSWMLMENIDHIIKVLTRKKYDARKRLRKEGLLYMCHLTWIFEHYGLSFEGYAKVSVKESWCVRKSSLKNMKI